MLQEITSLWDFYKKVETDKAYEMVAIRGYMSDTYNPNPPPYTYDTAKDWIENWVKEVVIAGAEDTCLGMVNFLNRTIRKINTEEELEKNRRDVDANIQATMTRLAAEQAQAQATGQPIITAQQTPPTPFTVRYATETINPTFYGTITIAPEEQATPAPLPTHVDLREQPMGNHVVENLWGYITPPPAVTPPTPPTARGPGTMTEYGWYDQEIETEIQMQMATHGILREDAIIRVFNEEGPPPPTPPHANGSQWADLGEDFTLDDFDFPEDDPREDR